MSYELCVFQPGYAADRDTAHALWNEEKYWASSPPDSDRSAAKWRTKDLLMGFDERLRWIEPEAPRTGLFAKWFGKPAPSRCYLHVYLDDDRGQTSFDLFDQAIEISLPWEAPNDEAQNHVRELWRILERLSAAGWSTIYDTERDVLLDLAKDAEAVTARYRENIGPDKDASDATPSKPAAGSPAKSDKPFTGNVG
jgi:hypothetical protein